MKKIAILVALVMLATSGAIAFLHVTPISIEPAQIVDQSLSNNPNGYMSLYASGGWFNASGNNIGNVKYTLEPVQGTYQYNNEPYIASSIMSTGLSSNFALVLNGNITIYAQAETTSSTGVVFTINFYTNVTINNNNVLYYHTVYNYNFPVTLYSGTVTQAFSLQLVPTTSLTGVFNNIATFTVTGVTSANPMGGWGPAFVGEFQSVKSTTDREVFVLPGTATLKQPQTPIEQGTPEEIYYSTGFAPTNGNTGTAYALEIFGSPAYNGGALITKIYLGQNIGNGEYTFNVPSNAFVQSTIPNANQFSVWLLDVNVGSFPLIEKQFFSIDNYSYEPPVPTITITNAPSNGQYYTGQTVDVTIHTTPNNITNAKISYVDIWVYSSTSTSAGAEYIIQDRAFDVTNNVAKFSFVVPDNPQSLYIQAESVDIYGRASKMVTYSISSYDIHTTHAPNISLIFEEIAFIVAMIGGFIAILFLAPTDMVSKLIIGIAWAASVGILMWAWVFA
jgi:hypothetical protein